MRCKRAVGAAVAPLVLLGAVGLGAVGLTHAANAQAFAANGGPTVSGALTSLSNYSIEFVFSLNGTGGYQKLIDFKDLAPDTGLYNLNGSLDFYADAVGPSPVFTPGQQADVLFTRNGATGVVTGSVNGVQQFQFTDTNGEAIFATNNIRFFQDDAATGQRESGPGVLYSIKVNGASVAAPEPSQATALALGILGLAGLSLRARRHKAAA